MHPVGQSNGRGYCYNPHHASSVVCKFQPPGSAVLPAPFNKVQKNRGDYWKAWLGAVMQMSLGSAMGKVHWANLQFYI